MAGQHNKASQVGKDNARLEGARSQEFRGGKGDVIRSSKKRGGKRKSSKRY